MSKFEPSPLSWNERAILDLKPVTWLRAEPVYVDVLEQGTLVSKQVGVVPRDMLQDVPPEPPVQRFVRRLVQRTREWW